MMSVNNSNLQSYSSEQINNQFNEQAWELK